MKLMIDIPEKVVIAIQNGEDYRYDIHTAIAQGIPQKERTQGDLISREDLKHRFAQITYVRFTADMGQGGFEMFSEKEIEDIIDKAPSVEVIPKELIRREDVIHLLERWSDGYSYIEIPTDAAIKAIKEMGDGAE